MLKTKRVISPDCVAWQLHYGLFEDIFASINCGLLRNVLFNLLHHLCGAEIGVEQGHEAVDVEHVYSTFDCLWQQLF